VLTSDDRWAAVKPEQLPDGQLPEHVLPDFDGEFGDRRQEIIFIGVGLQSGVVTKALDACLLSDDEMVEYRKHWTKVKSDQQAVRPTSAAQFAMGITAALRYCSGTAWVLKIISW
jgi:hypothetical protein